jgi:hypothetical protein
VPRGSAPARLFESRELQDGVSDVGDRHEAGSGRSDRDLKCAPTASNPSSCRISTIPSRIPASSSMTRVGSSTSSALPHPPMRGSPRRPLVRGRPAAGSDASSAYPESSRACDGGQGCQVGIVIVRPSAMRALHLFPRQRCRRPLPSSISRRFLSRARSAGWRRLIGTIAAIASR